MSKHQDLHKFVLKLNNNKYFLANEVVGRGNETQLQVVEEFNQLG